MYLFQSDIFPQEDALDIFELVKTGQDEGYEVYEIMDWNYSDTNMNMKMGYHSHTVECSNTAQDSYVYWTVHHLDS